MDAVRLASYLVALVYFTVMCTRKKKIEMVATEDSTSSVVCFRLLVQLYSFNSGVDLYLATMFLLPYNI